MATITINIPDDKLQREIDAFCEASGYSPKIRVLPTPENPAGGFADNPETKAQFVRRSILDFITRTSKDYRLQKARQLVTVED